ncbi:hypothetical protein FJT64_003232 [Amphibalanus amphitrite]|uniref:Uncharacterized protein n=1 Tax=Amphibalanus amphitrite TaxID=1232801 RepID=A0A6A4W5Y7_AMPAM|nr:hypothetical protein FJT64_003232 [Amphibalanus amphitrite]
MESELMEDEEDEEEEDDDEEEEEEEEDDDLDDEEERGAAAAGGGGQPGELDRSLELHLGTVLENEFSEVLSKLPDEAFTELFADPHAGDLVHKETEELERALEAVERESDAAPAARHHLLNGNPSLGAPGSAEMEESVYTQLAQGVSLENAISNVLNGQEMNTLNQLLTHLGDAVSQDSAS